MDALRSKALAFAHTFQDIYFKKRDLSGLLSIMAPEATWLGSKGVQPCHGKEEIGDALSSELREYPNPFFVIESKMDAVPLSCDTCMVTGHLLARPAEGSGTAGLHFRFSLICVRRDSGMYLLHGHISTPERDMLRNELYAGDRTVTSQASSLRQMEQIRSHMAQRSHKLENLMHQIPGGMHQCRMDDGLTFLSVSPSFLRLCGYTREELRTRFQDRLMDLICPQDRSEVFQQLHTGHESCDDLELEYRIQRKDGQIVWLLSRGNINTAPDGQETIYSVVLDVTRRKYMEEDLRLSLERHRIIMDQTSDVIFEWDIRSDRLIFSTNWKKKFGYVPIAEELSQHIRTSDNVHPDDRETILRAMDALATGTPYLELELRLMGLDGNYIWCRLRATMQVDALGSPIKAVGVIADIDADKRQQQQLMDQAAKDSLTGLLNRSTLQARVESHLKECTGPHALMIVDLDGFKSINDSFGHMCGDAVLSDTATALRQVFRRGDILGRIGGDEFLIFLPNIGSRETAARKAGELLSAISGILANNAARISCSVGVAMAPTDATDYDTLYQLADQALYQVKKTGKGSFAFSRGHTDAPSCRLPFISAVNRTIDSNVGDLDRVLSQYATQTLHSTSDVHSSLRKMLEIAGRACDVSRAYIFENSPDGRVCRNTFEWCADGIAPQIDSLQNCVYEEMGNYPENFDENGIFCCRDIRELPPENYRDLAPQGIVSMLQCAIRDEGKMIGFIGFDECRSSRVWTEDQIRALSLVASLLSNHLVKEQLKKRLAMMESALSQRQSTMT